MMSLVAIASSHKVMVAFAWLVSGRSMAPLLVAPINPAAEL
jgi:hypothetical protein